ncbi:MAG: MerR family transcriptional regulator [Firmicutes bacterium]|nr:MerR family transcriptional regulator [Bacillota bacterium]
MHYKTTGDLARDFGVSPSTIRHWTEQFKEFLSPAAGRAAENGFRVFDPVDVAKLWEIKRQRDRRRALGEIRADFRQHAFDSEYWAARVQDLEEENRRLRSELSRVLRRGGLGAQDQGATAAYVSARPRWDQAVSGR